MIYVYLHFVDGRYHYFQVKTDEEAIQFVKDAFKDGIGVMSEDGKTLETMYPPHSIVKATFGTPMTIILDRMKSDMFRSSISAN